ncbi:reverse transcriptase domain-containing protein [Tanacetum coccineum]
MVKLDEKNVKEKDQKEPQGQHTVTENPPPPLSPNIPKLQAMIDQGVTAALAARDANRNGNEHHDLGNRCQKDANAYSRMHLPRLHEIKFSTCTLLAGALTWWNSHVRIVGHDVAYAMTWIELRKKMTDKYCPRNEIKKLEAELWNLKVKVTDVTGYKPTFPWNLATTVVRMFPERSDKVERYVGGLPDMIHGSVCGSKPKTMQEATEMATELMDKKISTFADVKQRQRGN